MGEFIVLTGRVHNWSFGRVSVNLREANNIW
jgi:hypothetical protein